MLLKINSTILINKLSYLLMNNGKKKKVKKKVLSAFQFFNTKNMVQKNFCAITSLIYRLKPIMETKKVRKGAKYYDVPFLLKPKRGFTFFFRWFSQSIKSKKEKTFDLKIKKEIFDLILKDGSSVKESKLLRKKVKKNLKFSHYRWK
jgi:ribosomal protein S7